MEAVHISSHITTTQYKNFKMINLTHMVSILNSIFTIVFYVSRWMKQDLICIWFEEFLNQLNLFYICICLYLQQIKSYGHAS
jgi:hypothetical protein